MNILLTHLVLSQENLYIHLYLYYLCAGSLATIPMLSVAHSNVDATIVPQYSNTGHPTQFGYLSNSIAKLFKLFEI